MQILQLDPPVPYPLRAGPVTVALVGCGGTGSFLAQALARIATHQQARRDAMEIVLIDGDTVEGKNIGRQLFSSHDLRQNKSEAVAARFSRVFGLAMQAVPTMATASILRQLSGRSRSGIHDRTRLNILIGAVDSASGRRAMHEALGSGHWDIWLDCGNHEASGQVCVGSTTDRTLLATAIKHGVCSQLPAPSLIYPSLIAKAPRSPRANCAALMEDNLQALMVNQAMAAVASEYLSKILIQRRLTIFETVIDLTSLTMRSTPITARTIGSYATAAVVAPKPARKKAA